MFEAFKVLADRKKEVYDADVEALADTQMRSGPALWTLEAVTCNAGTGTIPMAAVCLWRKDGQIVKDTGLGDGPVDAVFNTMERITGIDVTLRDYRIRSVTVGEDAQGEALCEAEYNGRTVVGRAVSTDIIEASAQAFLQVINRIAMQPARDERRIRPTDAPPAEAVGAGL